MWALTETAWVTEYSLAFSTNGFRWTPYNVSGNSPRVSTDYHLYCASLRKERDRQTDTQRQRGRDRDRQRQTETDRDRQRQTETDRDRQRQTETDRDRQRQT